MCLPAWNSKNSWFRGPGERVKCSGVEEVRSIANDWETFSSNTTPGRIVIPSESAIREIRQVPIEFDPPEHTAYRKLLNSWFRRPTQAAWHEKIQALVSDHLDRVISEDSVEIVNAFSLVLQSEALTVLMGMPLEASKEWIGWGTHVFRSENDPLNEDKSNVLDTYINRKLDSCYSHPGDDLISYLIQLRPEGKPLPRETIHGILNLTFAGGRDTVINSITNIISYFCDHPSATILSGKAWKNTFCHWRVYPLFFSTYHFGRIASEDHTQSGCPIKKKRFLWFQPIETPTFLQIPIGRLWAAIQSTFRFWTWTTPLYWSPACTNLIADRHSTTISENKNTHSRWIRRKNETIAGIKRLVGYNVLRVSFAQNKSIIYEENTVYTFDDGQFVCLSNTNGGFNYPISFSLWRWLRLSLCWF